VPGYKLLGGRGHDCNEFVCLGKYFSLGDKHAASLLDDAASTDDEVSLCGFEEVHFELDCEAGGLRVFKTSEASNASRDVCEVGDDASVEVVVMLDG
jgi:hypothetical protein